MRRRRSSDAGPQVSTGSGAGFVADVRDALYASKIVSYAQGFMLFREAAAEYGWNLNYGGIALMWRGGCIIRSAFLGKIKDAFDRDPDLANLLVDTYFRDEVARGGGRAGVDRSPPPWARAYPCPRIPRPSRSSTATGALASPRT